ncbi:MAG: glycosyltransferase family 39 protein [Alphaproteobacteria bacterium]|nr:glycosyltransferase family 39 protein [Alphaproteobacteria bacterium]
MDFKLAGSRPKNLTKDVGLSKWAVLEKYFYAHPDLCFLLLCIVHLLVWTLVPAIVQTNLHIDVVECLAWGKEWQWGYHKHPPLHAWVTEIFFMPFGKAIWPGFFLSQLCVILTFICVWRFGKPIIGKTRTIVAIGLLEGIIYFQYTTPEFNSNVSLLPLWSWAIYSFYLALKRESVWYWLMFGIMMGLSILSKYASLLLGGVFFTFLVFTQTGRQVWRKPGVYISGAAIVVILYPHIQWVLANEGHTIAYFLARSQAHSHPWWYRLIFPMNFLLGQIVAVLGMVVAFVIIFRNQLAKSQLHLKRFFSVSAQERWEKTFIKFIALGPLLLVLLVSFILNIRLRTMWGMPFFTFLPFLLVVDFVPYISSGALKKFFRSVCVLMFLSTLAYAGTYYLEPYVLHKAKRGHFPGRVMAERITQSWYEYTHLPLQYVMGEIWEAGLVGFYSADRPSVFINGDYSISSWIKPGQLKEAGGVIVWLIKGDDEDMPATLKQRFPAAIIQRPLRLSYHTAALLEPAKIGWAILLPKFSGKDYHEI